MLKIRYQRTGRKNDPAYRIVVTEHTSGPKAGNNVAVVGSYHPKTKDVSIDGEAVKMWMDRGAKASDTVHNLLVSKGVIEGEKKNVLPKKSPIVKEEEPKEEAPQTEASEEDGGDAAEAPAEEGGDEEKKEEAPADDAPAEEAPAEEKPAEEAQPEAEETKE